MIYINISAMRQVLYQDDQGQLVTFKCSVCSQCITSKKSPRTTAISIQEKREQEIIEKGVDVDLDSQKVTVRLPYIVIPVKSLTKKHRADNYYKQAKQVYISQCRKPDDMKEAELVS